MKTGIAFALLLLTTFAGAQNTARLFTSKPDSNICLQVEGKITNARRNPGSECKAELLCANRVVDSVRLGHGKWKFTYLLQKNKKYAIHISGNGYKSMLISINTSIPKATQELYQFSFITTLAPGDEQPRAKSSADEIPVALIYFHPNRGYFYYEKYSAHNDR